MHTLRATLFLLAALLYCGSAACLEITPETARITTIGGIQKGLWNLWSGGEFGDHVRFAIPGTYSVVASVHGSPCKGVWPLMAFTVDWDRKKTVTVDRDQLGVYLFDMPVRARAYRITIAFLNDAREGNEDRNLYIEKISIQAPEGLPDPVIATEEDIKQMQQELSKEAEKVEQQVVEKAQAAIETIRKGNAAVLVVDAAGKPVPGASVAAEQVRHDFLFGCNIYMFDRFGKPEENAAYKQRFAELFNYATAGFYWQSYEPQRGKPNYAYTDNVAAWCVDSKIRMKGHPLLWEHEAGKPEWAGGKQPPEDVQKQRVLDIMRRYQGKIEFWEVVNESAHLPNLKIDAPYRWAREADPKANLIVNDFYVLADGCPAFLELLQDAIRNQVPFDGIGIQAHEPRTHRFPLDQVQRILDQYAALGKALHITEFTPCSDGQAFTGTRVAGVWNETTQADYAVKFYTVCFAQPAMAGITWWDLCDVGAWLPGGGMLRADLTPKPVYAALRKLIREQWHTRAEGKTDKAGRFAFRGFFGDYKLSVSTAGRTASMDGKLERRKQMEFTVKLP